MAANIAFPEKYIHDVESTLSDFIWQGKRPKVKQCTIIQPYNHGGLKMIDVRSAVLAQKATWFRDLHKPSIKPWKWIPNALLNNRPIQSLLITDLDSKPL